MCIYIHTHMYCRRIRVRALQGSNQTVADFTPDCNDVSICMYAYMYGKWSGLRCEYMYIVYCRYVLHIYEIYVCVYICMYCEYMYLYMCVCMYFIYMR